MSPKVDLGNYSNNYTETTISYNRKIKKVFYTASNCGDKIFSVGVNKWDAPGNIRFKQEQVPSFVAKNELFVYFSPFFKAVFDQLII